MLFLITVLHCSTLLCFTLQCFAILSWELNWRHISSAHSGGVGLQQVFTFLISSSVLSSKQGHPSFSLCAHPFPTNTLGSDFHHWLIIFPPCRLISHGCRLSSLLFERAHFKLWYELYLTQPVRASLAYVCMLGPKKRKWWHFQEVYRKKHFPHVAFLWWSVQRESYVLICEQSDVNVIVYLNTLR